MSRELRRRRQRPFSCGEGSILACADELQSLQCPKFWQEKHTVELEILRYFDADSPETRYSVLSIRAVPYM